jgi:hypothetical protein
MFVSGSGCAVPSSGVGMERWMAFARESRDEVQDAVSLVFTQFAQEDSRTGFSAIAADVDGFRGPNDFRNVFFCFEAEGTTEEVVLVGCAHGVFGSEWAG